MGSPYIGLCRSDVKILLNNLDSEKITIHAYTYTAEILDEYYKLEIICDNGVLEVICPDFPLWIGAITKNTFNEKYHPILLEILNLLTFTGLVVDRKYPGSLLLPNGLYYIHLPQGNIEYETVIKNKSKIRTYYKLTQVESKKLDNGAPYIEVFGKKYIYGSFITKNFSEIKDEIFGFCTYKFIPGLKVCGVVNYINCAGVFEAKEGN